MNDLLGFVLIGLILLSSAKNALSKDRTTTLIGGLMLAFGGFLLFSTPTLGSFALYVRNETNESIGFIGIALIASGMTATNWTDKLPLDVAGIIAIVIGSLLFAVSGFGDPIIEGLHNLQLAPQRTTPIE